MADSRSRGGSSISVSEYSDIEASMEGEKVKGSLVKSGLGDLNRQDEPKIERESHRRIKSLCAAASIKGATNG